MVPERVDFLQRIGVTNFEMEAGTIFTLCSLFGWRGGAACVVIADRFRNEFRPEGADRVLANIGAEAVRQLYEMDRTKERAGKRWYFSSLRTAD
jgi:uridine phosphorylase